MLLQVQELDSLTRVVNNTYKGNISMVDHYLSKAIYLLHYVSDEDVPEVEKQEVCFLLNGFRESFHKIAEERKGV